MKAKDVGGTSLLSTAVVAEAVEAAEAVVAIIGVANFLCLRMIFPKSWRGLGKALSGASRGFSNNNFSPK